MLGPAFRAAALAAMVLGVATPGLAEVRVDQVSIEARFVELSRSGAEELGIRWFQPSDSIQTQVFDFSGPSTLSTPKGNFNLILEALEANALSRVVANPRIVTVDNRVAEVSLQNQVPLATVDFSQIGISLTVTPSVAADGVRLTIAIASNGLTIPPGGIMPIGDPRQLDTSVLLPTDSAVAISGLFPDDMGDAVAELPFLGDIPQLGALFRSRNYQDGRTTPLALVFPYVVDSVEGIDSQDEPVMLQVAFVEASQSTLEDLGIDSQDGQIGTTVLDLGNIAPGAADPLASFQAFLDAIGANALTRTLAAPNLVALGDGSSEFVMKSPDGYPTVHFQEFGVTLSFTPRVNDDVTISMDIAGESTGPTFLPGGTIPTFETRRVQTSVELRDGESFAIAGLFADDVLEAGNQFPFLADIPLLGTLFRSDSSRNDETELVIIVSPHIVGGADDDESGGSSGGTATARPAQPRQTAERTASPDQGTPATVATATISTQTGGAPIENGQGRRLSGSLGGVTSRLDLNSRAGGGVVKYPGNDMFASQGPSSIRMNGFELSIDLDLNQANLFGVPDVVSRLLSSGQPTSKLYATFSRTSGDDQDHFQDANTSLDYGTVFIEEFDGKVGFVLGGDYDAIIDSMTQTESTWYRAAIGVATEYPAIFGHSRLTLEKSLGLFLEKLATDYDAETLVTLDGYSEYAAQQTLANIEDRYLGIVLGKTLYYALTQRLRVGVGGELSISHRSSSAEVRQHNASSAGDNFELVFDYDDSGLALGFGAALLAQLALNDRLHLELALRHQTLPGVTTLFIPETTGEIPVGATQESASRRSVIFAVNYDF